MKYTVKDLYDKELLSDCKNCFGLCCTALFFSACDGFPQNKEAGKPCINLKDDFSCKVHNNLRKKGLKGCTSYECFGSGQKTAQVTCKGVSWRDNPESACKMYDAFLIIRQLHEMLWYLTQSYTLQHDEKIKSNIGNLIDETIELTMSDIDIIFNIDVESHRNKVNRFLKDTSEMIRKKARHSLNKSSVKSKKQIHGKEFFGKNLTKADLCGADLRDADFSGADLSKSIFLTQAQINSAKGNLQTKLPPMIKRPSHWE